MASEDVHGQQPVKASTTIIAKGSNPASTQVVKYSHFGIRIYMPSIEASKKTIAYSSPRTIDIASSTRSTG